jgi:hypothetical protein
MTATPFERWQEQNREFLALAIDELYARMDRDEDDPEVIRERTEAQESLASLYERMEFVPALIGVTEKFELGPFEQDVVVLCIASELDPRFRVDGRPVTFGMVLESFPHAHWGALDPGAPLRRWGIVELDEERPLADAGLRLGDDLKRYLLGSDPRADDAEIFTIAEAPAATLGSQLDSVRDLVRTMALTASVRQMTPAVELHGASEEDRLALATICARELGHDLATTDARDLPDTGPELDRLLRRWNTRAQLTGTALCITGADDEDDPASRRRLARALGQLKGVVFASVDSPTTIEPARPQIRWEVHPLTVEERIEVWETFADASRKRLRIRKSRLLKDELRALASQFRLGARTIERVCLWAESLLVSRAERDDAPPDAAALAAMLREGCAGSVRARLDPLAERVSVQEVAELALRDTERDQIDELETQIRLAYEVNDRWGMGRGRAGGLTALFAGPSGTGKTHAAMALSKRLGLDLYRVNVAGVVSKYIGETEKNLDRIFEAAAVGGAILLFDEADAMFGKRSEVKDSHDRYANLGTAYLLQRIENAPTPTILTTNLKEAIDPAFTRRLHFVVDFPFPSEEDREEIWRSIFPPEARVGAIEPEQLAKLAATGGTISNIARRAAFLAAANGGAVEMHHLLASARRELRKSGRELSPDEVSAWR